MLIMLLKTALIGLVVTGVSGITALLSNDEEHWELVHEKAVLTLGVSAVVTTVAIIALILVG